MKTKRCYYYMKDHRFVPVEDYEDYTEESSDASESDELFIGGEAEAEELEHASSKKSGMLYIAS